MDIKGINGIINKRTQAYIYTTILLKILGYIILQFSLNLSLLANCRSQFLLDCLGRCLKLFVSTDSTSSHELTSQFGLAIFLYAKNTQKLSRRPSPAQVFVECAGHGRLIASDNMSGNNSDHSGERLGQNGDNESLYLHDLKNVV